MSRAQHELLSLAEVQRLRKAVSTLHQVLDDADFLMEAKGGAQVYFMSCLPKDVVDDLHRWDADGDPDIENDDIDGEDEGDGEPSLGSLDGKIHRGAWAQGGYQDLEMACDDDGVDPDDDRDAY